MLTGLGRQRVGSVSRLPGAERAADNLSEEALTERHELAAAPFPEQWIIEGKPVARNKCVATSTDGSAATYIWECTAGCFSWFYSSDETLYVLAGSVTVFDGVNRHVLNPGDTFFFPAGSKFKWSIEKYVRKLAFIHTPRSRKLRLLMAAFRALSNPLRLFRREH